MLILGIESSCDETGLALYSEDHGLIAHLVNSQIDLFTEYGVFHRYLSKKVYIYLPFKARDLKLNSF